MFGLQTKKWYSYYDRFIMKTGLELLLDFDGWEYVREDGYSVRFSVRTCEATPERPLGIRYSFTLHDKYGLRVFGMDNARAVKPARRAISGRRYEYDHLHRTAKDKGTPFSLKKAEELITLFYDEISHIP